MISIGLNVWWITDGLIVYDYKQQQHCWFYAVKKFVHKTLKQKRIFLCKQFTANLLFRNFKHNFAQLQISIFSFFLFPFPIALFSFSLLFYKFYRLNKLRHEFVPFKHRVSMQLLLNSLLLECNQNFVVFCNNFFAIIGSN